MALFWPSQPPSLNLSVHHPNPQHLVALVLISVAAQAEILEGKVVRIVDGDTLVLLDASNTQHRVRLAGIDTPERGQPFGRRASHNLTRLAGNKPARLEWYKRDRWTLLISTVWVQLFSTAVSATFLYPRPCILLCEEPIFSFRLPRCRIACQCKKTLLCSPTASHLHC